MAFVAGLLMAVLAYVAELGDWPGRPQYMTIGFAGYVLVISAAAYYLIRLLYHWARESEAWQG